MTPQCVTCKFATKYSPHRPVSNIECGYLTNVENTLPAWLADAITELSNNTEFHTSKRKALRDFANDNPLCRGYEQK